ncbi:MAG: hypothetical protein AAGG50_01870 [Bacteroidota bacterium]
MRVLFVVLLWMLPLIAPATAQPFSLLQLPQSPEAVALGDATVATSTADVLGFLANPALLGHPTANGLRLSGAPRTAWLGVDDLDRSSYAFSVGLDAQRFGIPLHLGIGVARSRLEFGTVTYRSESDEVIGEISPEESFTALNVGVGYDGPIAVSLGLGIRWAKETSVFLVQGGEEVLFPGEVDPEELSDTESLVLSATAVDLGVLADIPVARLAGWRTNEHEGVDLNVRLAYARTRGAEEPELSPEFPGAAFAFYGREPAPSFVRLGWAVTAGYDLAVRSGHVRAAALTLSVQADQEVTSPAVGDWFGSIRFADALIGRGDDGLRSCPDELPVGVSCVPNLVNPYIGRRGMQLVLGETFTASFGRFEGGGFTREGDAPTTYGLGFSLGGLVRLAGLLQENPRVYRLGERFDLRMTRSVYFASDDDRDFDRGTVFWGTTLSARLP